MFKGTYRKAHIKLFQVFFVEVWWYIKILVK